MKSGLLIILLFTFNFSFGTILNVPEDFPTIQSGINAAVDGDTVLVAPGTYYENIDYYGKNIVVASNFIFDFDLSIMYQTSIDAGNFGSVVTIENGETAEAVLTGFTLMNGYADYGGGIFIQNSNPTIAHCIVTNNSSGPEWFSGDGGGIAILSSNPTLENLKITNNYADYWGGGIYSEWSNPIINNVEIFNNTAHDGGGGMYIKGGAPNLSSVSIRNNSVISYSGNGGGIYFYESIPVFDMENRCSIYNNNCRLGADLGNFSSYTLSVPLDTFSVLSPTDYYTKPVFSFNLDIIIGLTQQVHGDLFVSPDGDNANSGISFEDPLLTLDHALSKIAVDSVNQRTIHLSQGTYSTATTGEPFPIMPINYLIISGQHQSNTIFDANDYSWGFFYRDIIIGSLEQVTVSNGSSWVGGGFVMARSSPILNEIIISNNQAYIGAGAAVFANSQPIFNHVLIHENNNIAAGYSGIIQIFDNANVFLNNVTISNNSFSNFSNYSAGVYGYSNGSLTVNNSILWNQGENEIIISEFEGDYSIVISYTNIQNGQDAVIANDNVTLFWLEGNIDENPLFVNPENEDFTLQENSPCINAGTDFFVWEGDTLVDMSEDEYVGNAPDMGAFEFREALPGDVNMDGEVNVHDIVVTVNYILSDDYFYLADLNADGNVNVLDIVMLVNLILE